MLASLCSGLSQSRISNDFYALALVGEVSPYAATPRCARVCAYPLRGDTPRRPVRFLTYIELCACPRDALSNTKTVKKSLEQAKENQASV
jgi:hypothetical protein